MYYYLFKIITSGLIAICSLQYLSGDDYEVSSNDRLKRK